MQKVFHFDAPRNKYHCDAAIVWCFDNRFELGFRKFLKRIGVVNSDPIKIAGGAKCLAAPEHETDREFVLEADSQIHALARNQARDPDAPLRLRGLRWTRWRFRRRCKSRGYASRA